MVLRVTTSPSYRFLNIISTVAIHFIMVVCSAELCKDEQSVSQLTCHGCNMMYHPTCLNLSRLSRNIEEILSVFTFICTDCKNRTTYDLIKAIGHLNSKLNSLADKADKRDRHMREQLTNLSTTVETSSRNGDTSVMSSCNYGIESRLDKMADGLDQLTNLVTTSLSTFDTRMSAIEPLKQMPADTINQQSTPQLTQVNYDFEGGSWISNVEVYTYDFEGNLWVNQNMNRRKAKKQLKKNLKQHARNKDVGNDIDASSTNAKKKRQRTQNDCNGDSSDTNEVDQRSPAGLGITLEMSTANNSDSRPSYSTVAAAGTQDTGINTSTNGVNQDRAPRSQVGSFRCAVGDTPRQDKGTYAWIYIANCENVTTAEAITEYVRRKTQQEDVLCHLLLRRGIDPCSRNKLSFKVRVKNAYADQLLKRRFWPHGVTARKFNDNKDFTINRQRQESQPVRCNQMSSQCHRCHQR